MLNYTRQLRDYVADPTCSTERTELFQHDDSRVATIDLKQRKRPAPNTPVPFADVEDDQNLTAVSPNEVSNDCKNKIYLIWFLPRDACIKRGLCRHAVSVRVCICLSVSVTFVSCVKTNKDIFEIFTPSGSPTILVFPHQTGWRYSDGNPLTRASNAGGVGKQRDSGRIWLHCIQVYSVINHTSREM